MNSKDNDQTQIKKPAILWAVDPFQTDLKPDAAGVERLVAWAQVNGYDIKPVYVVSTLNEGFDVMTGTEEAEFVDLCKTKTERYMHAIGVPETLKPKILTVGSRKSRAMVESLVKLAGQYQSPWIVVSSHGYHGLNRAVFGSFAETVLRYAKQPVLFLSQMKSTSSVGHATSKRLLFPTDFSLASHAAFQEMLKLAKGARFEILLFYVNMWPTLATGIEVPIVITPALMDEQERQAREEGYSWIQEAAEEGVDAKLVCEAAVPTYEIASSILRQAKDLSVDFISLACTSGSLSAFLFGSVSRDVFREAECPVLVYGPQTTEDVVQRMEDENQTRAHF